MLDELPVQCVQCRGAYRRGQFEHECRPMKQPWPREQPQTPVALTMIPWVASVLLLVVLACRYRERVFYPAIDRGDELITNVGIDIDRYLFASVSYLLARTIEYLIPVLLVNVVVWLCIEFYGDRLTSKAIAEIVKKFVEASIIINLITYSIYY